MRAARFERKGPAGRDHRERHAGSNAGWGEVRVRVLVSAVNPTDTNQLDHPTYPEWEVDRDASLQSQ
jgi:NADPH:quinone reductase-like Zn-dependent oxidoreductase